MGSHLFQESVVNLEDYLQMSGQQTVEQIHRPCLQGFRQQSVVGERKGLAADLPGTLPGEVLFIHQYSHELRYSNYGVGIVQLDDSFLREMIPIIVHAEKSADDISQGTGYKEILLLQAQLLPLWSAVVGVKDFGDIFRIDLPINRASVIPLVK